MIDCWVIQYISGVVSIFRDLDAAPDKPFKRLIYRRAPPKLIRMLAAGGAVKKGTL
jgi:hypothetical protein